MSGSMQSNVGNSQVYNDGDQRYVSTLKQIILAVSDLHRYSRPDNQSNIQRTAEVSYEAGQENSHNILDSKFVL
jgi:hypothetical protein